MLISCVQHRDLTCVYFGIITTVKSSYHLSSDKVNTVLLNGFLMLFILLVEFGTYWYPSPILLPHPLLSGNHQSVCSLYLLSLGFVLLVGFSFHV